MTDEDYYRNQEDDYLYKSSQQNQNHNSESEIFNNSQNRHVISNIHFLKDVKTHVDQMVAKINQYHCALQDFFPDREKLFLKEKYPDLPDQKQRNYDEESQLVSQANQGGADQEEQREVQIT